ncbi:hypothetical protein K7957_09780 [Sphingomonas yunnanensis]|uniref:hypothetical protein n=1 Tax=Sphingomonas yunnanensis TaxID=310400 RepID=UPI001CA68019|nr:hypothetical protein [Sphingomonas yunnanensis]MBY9063224.1 hypothetical protein [Sphingomonas yunnanensis]
MGEQQAGWVGAEIRNRDGSYDLGTLQINSRWVDGLARLIASPPEHERQWLRDDPCFNVEAARWIVLTDLAATKDF